ncbi:MAG: phage major tail protein, TP901-1 family [Alphaproteobacteria bacterium]
MAAQKGSLLLLKVGDGGEPESFTTIGGLRTNSLTHNNQTVDTTNKDSGAWRQLLQGAGLRSVSLTGSGVFTDSATEETVRGYAMANEIRNYQMTFGNGDVLEGPFHITAYQRAGSYNNEETYSLTLVSAGTVTFTPA